MKSLLKNISDFCSEHAYSIILNLIIFGLIALVFSIIFFGEKKKEKERCEVYHLCMKEGNDHYKCKDWSKTYKDDCSTEENKLEEHN